MAIAIVLLNVFTTSNQWVKWLMATKVIMAIDIDGLTPYEINSPLQKGTWRNYKVQSNKGRIFLRGISMEISSFFNDLDVIRKQGKPIIASSNDHLGSIHPKRMSNTRITLILIWNILNLIKSEIIMEYIMNASFI